MAMLTFFQISCKKNICYCPQGEWCHSCVQFSDTLYNLKLEDDSVATYE